MIEFILGLAFISIVGFSIYVLFLIALGDD